MLGTETPLHTDLEVLTVWGGGGGQAGTGRENRQGVRVIQSERRNRSPLPAPAGSTGGTPSGVTCPRVLQMTRVPRDRST